MSTRKAAARGASRQVAVQIGAQFVRAVEIELRDGKPRIVKQGQAPAPLEVWSFLAERCEELATAIKAALSTAGISTNSVSTAVPRRLVTLKYAQLPKADPELIAGAVQFEAQKYIPFALDEVVIGHQVQSDHSDDMTTVMIVAARQSLLEDLLRAFDKAGLEISSITVSSLALAEHIAGEARPTAIVGVLDDDVDVSVVSAGNVIFTRASSLSAGASGTRTEQLASELAISLNAYRNEHRGMSVDGVVIAASKSDAEALNSALAGKLTAQVRTLPGLMNAGGESADYAEAVGIALEDAGGGISSVNLTPPSRIEKRVAARQRSRNALVGLAAAALIIIAVVFANDWMKAQKREQYQANLWNRRLKQAQAALTKSTSEHDQVVRTYKAVENALPGEKPIVDLVKAVSDAVPANLGIYLTQLAFERGGAITINGATSQETAATELVISLQKSGAFRDVRLTYLGDADSVGVGGGATATAVKSETRMSFTIACRLKSDPAAADGKTGGAATNALTASAGAVGGLSQ